MKNEKSFELSKFITKDKLSKNELLSLKGGFSEKKLSTIGDDAQLASDHDTAMAVIRKIG